MFIDMASNSTLQIIFRKPRLVEFGCITKEEFHKYMKRPPEHTSLLQLRICYSLSFLPILQPKLDAAKYL